MKYILEKLKIKDLKKKIDKLKKPNKNKSSDNDIEDLENFLKNFKDCGRG